MKFCWHKWKKVYKEEERYFLGEAVPHKYEAFRICTKCGKAQAYECSISGCWKRTLKEEEVKILKNSIIDKGDYYVLKPGVPV